MPQDKWAQYQERPTSKWDQYAEPASAPNTPNIDPEFAGSALQGNRVPRQQPNMLWQAISSPGVSADSPLIRGPQLPYGPKNPTQADLERDMSTTRLSESPFRAGLRTFGEGVMRDTRNLASSLTSPLNLAITAATLGEGTVGNVARTGVGAGIAGYGTSQAITPQQPGETQADAAQRRLLGGAGAVGGATLVGSQLAKIPTLTKARASFQDVMSAAKNIPVDVTAPGNTALQINKLAESGGSMPKVVRDFIKRTTDPSKGPLTYEEARDFYSNASRLSADETQRLTPVMKMQVGQFRADLGKSIAGAADQVGKLEQYQAAMGQYRQAIKLQVAKNALIKKGIPLAAGGAATAVGAKAGYDAYKAITGR